MSTRERSDRLELLQGTLDLLILRTLIRSPQHGLLDTNPGFRPDRVMTGSIDLPATAYGLTALAATYVPARRATRIEPVRALRHE